MNQSNALWQSDFFWIGYASTKNSLVPNTWKYNYTCIDLFLACIVSVAIIKSNRLNPNILSALYLRLSGTTVNRLRRCVLAFSVNFACAMLILHISLKSSGLVFECRSDDMNVRGCLNSSGCSGGSRTTPSVIFFPSFSLCIISTILSLVTNSATCLC